MRWRNGSEIPTEEDFGGDPRQQALILALGIPQLAEWNGENWVMVGGFLLFRPGFLWLPLSEIPGPQAKSEEAEVIGLFNASAIFLDPTTWPAGTKVTVLEAK